MAIDRRIARTRTALYDALVALIGERDYDAIRIDDILERANVGRSTFYTHFKSKDELLARSLDRLRYELLGAIEALPAPDAGVVSQTLFQHIDGHRNIQASIAGGAANTIVRRAIVANFAQVIRPLLPPRAGAIPRELVIEHISATLLCVLEWWLDRNPATPWQEAESLFRKLVRSGLSDQWPAADGPTAQRGAAHRILQKNI